MATSILTTTFLIVLSSPILFICLYFIMGVVEKRRVEAPLRNNKRIKKRKKKNEAAELKARYTSLFNTSKDEFFNTILELKVKKIKFDHHDPDFMQQLSAYIVPIITLFPVTAMFSIAISDNLEDELLLLLSSQKFNNVFLLMSAIIFSAFTFNLTKTRFDQYLRNLVNIHLLIAEDVLKNEKNKQSKILLPSEAEYQALLASLNHQLSEL